MGEVVHDGRTVCGLGGQQVKKYIELYTDHFGLRESIRFNTKLLSARPLDSTGGPLQHRS